MPDRELATTRIALLELGEERRTAREGYALLDEKRMLLAARALAAIERVVERRRDYDVAWHEALDALRSALDRHGVLALESWPAVPEALAFDVREHGVLGVRLPELAERATPSSAREADGRDGAAAAAGTSRLPTPATAAPLDDSPEARECADRFRALLARAVPLATLETALWRMADEYRRTERRTAAIEHVLLPELEQSITQVEQALEAVDQEEALRVRTLGARREADQARSAATAGRPARP